MGRATKPIELTEEERAKLQEWASVLENRQVARQLHVADQTICKWRERFRTARLEGLVDEPRPGTPRKITDAQVEALITRTLETAPSLIF
jgi:transposase